MYDDNYAALCVSIISNVPPEEALRRLEVGRPKNNQTLSLTHKDVEDMKKMKLEGMTYREIAGMYGISEHSVFNRINRAYYEGDDNA